MANSKFRFYQRLNDFWQNFRSSQLRSPQFLLYGIGWLLTFFVFATSLPRSETALWISIGIHFYFWFKFLDEIRVKIRPLPEFSLLLFPLVFLLERWFWKATGFAADIQPGDLPQAWSFSDLFQLLLLAPLFLLFSHLLIQNEKSKKGGIVYFFFLGFLFHILPAGGSDLLFWLFQAFLLVSLLKHTTWLEELTRLECGIYFLLILFFLNVFSGLNPFAESYPLSAERSWLWHSLPYYLFLLFKFYLAALLVRIPLVVVYNYATLSRKLRISGFFQSTVPQLIQLTALVVIFYFFLSAWQAKNLQDSLLNQLKRVEANRPAPDIQAAALLFAGDGGGSIKLPGYEPLSNWPSLPDNAVLKIRRQEAANAADSAAAEYFLFGKDTIKDSSVVQIIKIDSIFLKAISQNLQFLAGSSLAAYPFAPDRWASYLYDENLNFWQQRSHLYIFPFSLLPYEAVSPLEVKLEAEDRQPVKDDTLNIRIAGMQVKQFAVGRVFLPFQGDDPGAEKYFAFDILLNLQSGYLWAGLGPILLFMIIVYFLLNAFVIRRMVKFGTQINKLIVQKFRQLQSGIQEISGGNLDYKIRFEGEDEFTELGDRFNEMGDRLKQTIAETREKERLHFELQNARQVQLSLLPRQLPEIPGYRVAASLHTAAEVGGDFYDMFPLPKGKSKKATRFLITIGDVSGKGSSAAFYMAQCMSLIRFSRQFTADPAEICTRLNEYFTATMVDRQIFVTAIVGVLDIETHQFVFVRAGHTHPIFIPGEYPQKIRYLETKGLGIGLTGKDKIFEKNIKPIKITFEPGDTLLLYTDGVIEASRPAAKQNDSETRDVYEESRLETMLEKLHAQDAEYIQRELEMDLQAFYAGHARVDDHTVVILQRIGVEKSPETEKSD